MPPALGGGGKRWQLSTLLHTHVELVFCLSPNRRAREGENHYRTRSLFVVAPRLVPVRCFLLSLSFSLLWPCGLVRSELDIEPLASPGFVVGGWSDLLLLPLFFSPVRLCLWWCEQYNDVFCCWEGNRMDPSRRRREPYVVQHFVYQPQSMRAQNRSGLDATAVFEKEGKYL